NFTRTMAERADNRIYGTLQTEGQNNKSALLSESSNDNNMEHNISSLDVLLEIYNTKLSCISYGAKYTILSPDDKSHILEMKRENFEVHVQCVNSFRTSDKGDKKILDTNARIKSEEHIDIKSEFKLYPRSRETTNDQGSMSLVSKYDEQNDAFCDNIFMVVDTYANDYNIASFIGCELPSDSGDPKGLELYITGLGYEPNVVVNGNSLEEARLNDRKDNLYWIVLNDGTVEEFKQSLKSPELSEYVYKKKNQKLEKEKKVIINIFKNMAI
ncbi:23898_t:CDS:2, partial [Dentiscutata erythropus]